MSWAEADWERLRPPVELSLELARELFAKLGLGTPRALALLEGGKANTNYRVSLTDHADVVVRIYERDAGALAREAALLELLDEAIPAPRLLSRTALPDQTPVGVFTFLPGVHPSSILDQDTAPALGRACGRTLALLAHHRFDRIGLFADDLGFARCFDSVADSFVDLITWSLSKGRARRRLPAELRAELDAKLERAAARLAPLDADSCLCHGDYKFSNLLVDTRGGALELTGVLDWEFACAFSPMLDVAILMRHREGFPPGFCAGFEAAYRAGGGPLPDDWRELSRIVDLMNLVGFLNGAGARPTLYAHVIRLIADTLAGL
jgi:Ser/Thr protein kinase RdoA (MazF antagonist)